MGFAQRSYKKACEIYKITRQKAQVTGFTADNMMLDGLVEKQGAAKGEQKEPIDIVVSLVLLKQNLTASSSKIYRDNCFKFSFSDSCPYNTEA